METKSEALEEVQKVSIGIEDAGVVVKEQAAVLEEESEVVAMTKDDEIEMEKCALLLHTLPAPSDGENGITPSQAPEATEAEKEREGCNGDDGGHGDKPDGLAALPEFLPVPEADGEAAWGDVPDAGAERPPKRPRVAPECVEVDDVVQTMRNILFNLTYEDDAHLNPEDEAKVRELLAHHPKAADKTGSGIDFIKIKRHSTFKDVRCFWVVRTDGTETDFSYHKCLKEKVAKEVPSFVDRYDAVYRQPKRPRMA